MVPLRAYSGISESLEVALQVYSSSDCSTIRLHVERSMLRVYLSDSIPRDALVLLAAPRSTSAVLHA